MSINLPDLIWTVICFLLFMLVLNGLLLKPVLRVMDARNDRIARAKALDEKRRADAEEALRLAEERSREARERAALEEKAALNAGSERARAELEAYALALEEKEKESAGALGALAEETDAVLKASMDEMAEAFKNKLISGGRS